MPNDRYMVEGNTNLYYPFSLPGFTLRFQQVYAASQFQNVPSDTGDFTNLYAPVAEGGWISDLWFRADGYSPGFFTTLSDVEVHLSTTLRSPNGLSPVFVENVGADDAVVFSGSFSIANGGPSSPGVYGDTHLPLSTNFLYRPSQGNLLLDIRVYQGAPVAVVPPFDAQDSTNGVVSCIYSEPNGVDAPTGTPYPRGLVTFFSIAPRPALLISTSNVGTPTNYIELRWAVQPTGFVLQQSSSMGPDGLWQSLPGAGGPGGYFKKYRIPVASAGPEAYFRLVWTGGQ